MSQPQKYRDEAWLRARLRAGSSRRDIAEECSVGESTVEEWIERFDVRLYRDADWLRERVEDYWTPAQIAAACAVTERTVERWMDRFDVERPDPPTAAEIEEHLEERYDDPGAVEKKERMVALLGKFGPLTPKGRVVEVVGCSADYASRSHWSEEERRVVERHRRDRESQSIHDRLRRSVLERDDHCCVRCGAGDAEDVEIHHVIPGESQERNLATLCPDGHIEAHGGAYGDGVAYESRAEFWEEWAIGEPAE